MDYSSLSTTSSDGPIPVLVQSFITSTSGPQLGSDFEIVKGCFQMLVALPGGRTTVLEQLNNVFLRPSILTELTGERQRQLLNIISELSLADWAQTLGLWSINVLSRARHDVGPFLPNLLVQVYAACKSRQEADQLASKAPPVFHLEWFFANLLMSHFANRTAFRDLIQRLVANFPRHFVQTLLQVGAQRQNAPNTLISLSTALDSLGNGFPTELQSIVDQLLTGDEYGLFLLLDLTCTNTRLCWAFQSRLAASFNRSRGNSLRPDLAYLLTPSQVAAPHLMKPSAALKQCILTKTDAFGSFLRAVLTKFPETAFATGFLDDLLALPYEKQTSLFRKFLEDECLENNEPGASFLLRRTVETGCLHEALPPFTQISSITVMVMNLVGRPEDVFEMFFVKLAQNSSESKLDEQQQLGIFLAIIAGLAASKNLTLHRNFGNVIIDRWLLQKREGRREIVSLLLKLLQLEQKAAATISLAGVSIAESFAKRLPELFQLLPTSEADLFSVVDFLVYLVPLSVRQSNVAVVYPEKIGLAVVYQLTLLLSSRTDMSVSLLSQSHLKEKILYLLHYFAYCSALVSSSANLLVMDQLLRETFSSIPIRQKLSRSPAVLSTIFLAIKILSSNLASKEHSVARMEPFDPILTFKQIAELPPSSSPVLNALGNQIVSILSPDLVHASVTSYDSWPIEPFDTPDYREYCLRVRQFALKQCPAVFDLLALFIRLVLASADTETERRDASETDAATLVDSPPEPIKLLAPLFQALLASCIFTCNPSNQRPSPESLAFISKLLSILQAAKVLRSPLCHLPTVLTYIAESSSQLGIALRCVWIFIAETTVHQTGHTVAQNAVVQIVTMLKAKLKQCADVIQLFEVQPNQLVN